jgi:peptidoglycan hydrolase-like protein with peptidoglycan-binding domain
MARRGSFLLGCILIGASVAVVMAQGEPTPVMRIGEWVEVGGATPVVGVLQAQERLKATGFDPGPVNGMLDARTQAALRQYQRQQGLPVTGTLDAATRKALAIK